ncbi:putative ubiquitin-like-specific protease 1B [Platanthera guangdongensis]|uniref:Ubiquitin-like-specific protease 1B n=1 Tax=Platanthera guangdongensis TaxID=2320717 RepID=A0ABR2LJC7_9ASPA
MKLTVNEVALVLRLPNSGVPFKFTRSPLLDLTHKWLNEKLSEVTEEEWSPALEERRISLIVKYLLCMFFFPLKNLKVPACLDGIKDIQDFVKYNWPQAIHGFMHSQFDGLSKICEVRWAGENIEYLEGCATVLLVWLYEHTKIQPPLIEAARPRIYRWSPTLSYSAKLCLEVERNLRRRKYVITTFANVGDNELSLLGVEELESDFETVPEKKEKRKRDVKVDSLGYESEKEKKMKNKKQEQELLKKIMSEIKKERRGMEARLKSYIKSEVEGLKTFCESLFLKFQLKSLQEDALHAFPEGFIDWPVVDARKSPQQSNSYDCGVFVIKYMEVVTSLEVVTWQDHQGWQADMPRFRAEIAAQICKTFAMHIADKMAAC